MYNCLCYLHNVMVYADILYHINVLFKYHHSKRLAKSLMVNVSDKLEESNIVRIYFIILLGLMFTVHLEI